MVTRSSSSRSSDGKSASASSGRARASAADAAAEAIAGAHETFVKPLKGMADEMAKRMQSLPVAGALMQNGRKDLEALMQVNEQSLQGLQSLVQRQTEMLKTSIEQWQDTVKSMSPGEPRENIAKLDALGKAAFKQALQDIRELSDLAARSQAQAFEVVRQRIHDNVEEASKLLSPGRGQRK